jgi:hypothetical protein
MHIAVLVTLLLAQAAAAPARNTWPETYAKKDAAAFAAEFEEPSRALFRYRAAMTGLMQLEPGMQVGEVGAGSGYLSRFIAEVQAAVRRAVRERLRRRAPGAGHHGRRAQEAAAGARQRDAGSG